MNVHSSRSHAIFRIYLDHRWRDEKEEGKEGEGEGREGGGGGRMFKERLSEFCLVDLAGSEQQGRTENSDCLFKVCLFWWRKVGLSTMVIWK